MFDDFCSGFFLLADGLRHRGHNEDEEDMNQMLKHHRELQEKAVEEMLGYTHQMKQNFAAAGRVVRDDTRVCSFLFTSTLCIKNFNS